MRSLRFPVGLAILTAAAALVLHAYTPETPAQRDARMAWWREARFGMFVHWGLYSGLAGSWNGKPVATSGGMEWIENMVKADTDTYAKQAIPLFTPKPGFATEWAHLAREAGAKYIVVTSKHHEGFALHDSSVSEYDAGTVLHRDLIKEIVDAARAEGLRIGFYHSVIDWHHDQYEYARSTQLPHPLRGQPYPNGTRDHRKYQEYLKAEVDELLSHYGPIDVLWWDFSAQDFQGQEAWRAFDLMDLARDRNPNIIQNNRLFRSVDAGWTSMAMEGYAKSINPKYGDFITPEQSIPDTGMPGVDWETCMTMNTTWGYSAHDHAWKSNETLIRNLVDIASKGGNYLLNVGPTGDGSVPKESVAGMKAIGAWLKVNGASIYGTTASRFAHLPWGRSTTKGSTVYLQVFDWPKDGTLVVPGLRNAIKSARLLGSGPVAASPHPRGVALTLPPDAPDPIASVVELVLDGPPSVQEAQGPAR